jgi:hypothetical protein
MKQSWFSNLFNWKPAVSPLSPRCHLDIGLHSLCFRS